ncbi:MAG: hypothetical protein MHM6MM_006313, partial [Cercozoa sp. M6MM]
LQTLTTRLAVSLIVRKRSRGIRLYGLFVRCMYVKSLRCCTVQARTPYGVEALKFNRGNRGGKMDDCSVVLGLVCTRDEIEGQQYQAQEGEAGDSYVYSASIDDSDYEYTSSTSPLAGAP